MLCPKCGANLPDNAVFCGECGAQLTENAQHPNNAYAPPPNNAYTQPANAYQQAPGGKPLSGTIYLVLSIIATLCCCLPFGIAGIVYATKIDKLVAMGQYDEAQAAAKKSKMWIIVSAVVGVVVGILYFVLVMAGTMAGLGY